MGDGGAGSSGGDGGSAGIGEKVQYLYGSACIADKPGEPVPVCRLLREKPGMLEAEGL